MYLMKCSKEHENGDIAYALNSAVDYEKKYNDLVKSINIIYIIILWQRRNENYERVFSLMIMLFQF